MKNIFKGKTNKIVLDKYYDLHGMIIDEGRETITLPKESNVTIDETKTSFGFTVWEVKVNGKRIAEDYDITGYAHEPTQLVLHACTGEG